jgi:hypothetical protein
MRKEQTSGSASRRSKLAVGLLILMAHLTLGESTKTCTPLSIREIESRAQKTSLDCFTAYPHRQMSEYEREGEAPPHTPTLPTPLPRGMRGDDNIPKDNHIVVSIANGSAFLDSYFTRTALLDLAQLNRTDVMVISEPGRKATEAALTWGTHHIDPGETETRVF